MNGIKVFKFISICFVASIAFHGGLLLNMLYGSNVNGNVIEHRNLEVNETIDSDSSQIADVTIVIKHVVTNQSAEDWEKNGNNCSDIPNEKNVYLKSDKFLAIWFSWASEQKGEEFFAYWYGPDNEARDLVEARIEDKKDREANLVDRIKDRAKDRDERQDARDGRQEDRADNREARREDRQNEVTRESILGKGFPEPDLVDFGKLPFSKGCFWLMRDIQGTRIGKNPGLWKVVFFIGLKDDLINGGEKFKYKFVESFTIKDSSEINSASDSNACLASDILEDDADLSASKLSDVTGKLNIFRKFRDVVLSKDLIGLQLISFYYKYSNEVTTILNSDDNLKSRAIEILNELTHVFKGSEEQSSILDVVNNSIPVWLDISINMLIDDIKELGSEELNEAIEKSRAALY